MFPFEHHCHILCAGDPTDLVGDLLAQSLLQLQAMRKLVRNPREFREAQHFCVGDVADGDITPEWQEMVLTKRCDPYAGHTYHLVGGHRGKRRLGGASIILYKFAPGVGPPTWRLSEPFAIRILPDGEQQLAP